MIIPITKLPLWSKCHPKNDLVVVYDNFEQRTVFANHRERMCLDELDRDDRHLCLDYKTFMKNGYKCYVNFVNYLTILTIHQSTYEIASPVEFGSLLIQLLVILV